MKKFIFTIYLLLLFALAAVANPPNIQKIPVDGSVIIMKTVDRQTFERRNLAVERRRVHVRQHRRMHRRDVRPVRREIQIHRRHAVHCK